MLRALRRGATAVEPVELAEGWKPDPTIVWLDLISPTREEETIVEAGLGVALPTREDMSEIEASSRVYQEDGVLFMTADVLTGSAGQAPRLEPVTFVMMQGRLITIRYAKPRALDLFESQLADRPENCSGGVGVLMGLLDAIVDRVADILEGAQIGLESLSGIVFERPRRTARFEVVLIKLGKLQAVTAKARNSLSSLNRIGAYIGAFPQLATEREAKGRLKTLQRDIQSLTGHAGYLAGDITFLLDAVLGMISIEQNSIIKIFSVAAVVFLPPTLIASIYGMNFEHIPELKWYFGYPLALGTMIISAAAPLWFFKRKGWL